MSIFLNYVFKISNPDNLINTLKNNLNTWTKEINDLCNDKDGCKTEDYKFKSRVTINSRIIKCRVCKLTEPPRSEIKNII